MVGFIIGTVIITYTIFIIYKKSKDAKAGRSCCSGCAACPRKGKCNI